LFLKKQSVTSNSSRNVVTFSSNWFLRKNFKGLTFRKKWLSGRSSLTGRVVVRTKSSTLLRIKLLKINYTFRTKEPGFVSTLKLVPFSNKLLSLVHFMSGGCSYLPALDTTKVFSVLSFRARRPLHSLFNKYAQFALIHKAPLFRKVSNLELIPNKGMQYARSAGTSAKIIKVDLTNHTAFVKLPSGVRKFFSVYSSLMLGPSALKLKRKTSNTRSGFWRSYGVKSKVRGVAMNPIDHPHGGRTKSIKYPRTPWGKTTKFK
jgi:large subunit ribosomal protein L2